MSDFRQIFKTQVRQVLDLQYLNPSEAVNATHEAVADYYSQRLTPPFCIPFSEPDRELNIEDIWSGEKRTIPQYRINVAEQYRRQCEAYVRHMIREEVDRKIQAFADAQGHVDVPHLLDRVIRLEQELGTCDPVNKVELLKRRFDQQIGPEIELPAVCNRLNRLTDHINREIGVAQDTPLHKRVTSLENNAFNFSTHMGTELTRLENHFQELIRMLTKRFLRRTRRTKEK